MQGASNYFADTIATQRELRRHGFEAWPTEEEALRYLFDVSDRLDAVCEALGLEAGKDVRGKWALSFCFCPKERSGAPLEAR